eukprot:TRINITY_DN101863_c0_g1_i1.p1 TRINITY_DN101863_c0_g1~~TRINITY_DN101863_c0_g1_i1.p1  ORF type:complete len:522 (-),score=77.21 TRINITY_DN101863_c0_g1_i1:73-1530(-)
MGVDDAFFKSVAVPQLGRLTTSAEGFATFQHVKPKINGADKLQGFDTKSFRLHSVDVGTGGLWSVSSQDICSPRSLEMMQPKRNHYAAADDDSSDSAPTEPNGIHDNAPFMMDQVNGGGSVHFLQPQGFMSPTEMGDAALLPTGESFMPPLHMLAAGHRVVPPTVERIPQQMLGASVSVPAMEMTESFSTQFFVVQQPAVLAPTMAPAQVLQASHLATPRAPLQSARLVAAAPSFVATPVVPPSYAGSYAAPARVYSSGVATPAVSSTARVRASVPMIPGQAMSFSRPGSVMRVRASQQHPASGHHTPRLEAGPPLSSRGAPSGSYGLPLSAAGNGAATPASASPLPISSSVSTVPAVLSPMHLNDVAATRPAAAFNFRVRTAGQVARASSVALPMPAVETVQVAVATPRQMVSAAPASAITRLSSQPGATTPSMLTPRPTMAVSRAMSIPRGASLQVPMSAGSVVLPYGQSLVGPPAGGYQVIR